MVMDKYCRADLTYLILQSQLKDQGMAVKLGRRSSAKDPRHPETIPMIAKVTGNREL